MGATTNHQKLEYKPPTTLVLCNIHLQLELGLHPRLGYMLNPCLYKTTARASYSPLVLQAGLQFYSINTSPSISLTGNAFCHASFASCIIARLVSPRCTVSKIIVMLCSTFLVLAATRRSSHPLDRSTFHCHHALRRGSICPLQRFPRNLAWRWQWDPHKMIHWWHALYMATLQ